MQLLLRALNRRRLTKSFQKNGIVVRLWRFMFCNLTCLGKKLPIPGHRHTSPPVSAIGIRKERVEFGKGKNCWKDLRKWKNGLKDWNHGTKIVGFLSEERRRRWIFLCSCVTTWTWKLVRKKTGKLNKWPKKIKKKEISMSYLFFKTCFTY